MKRALFQIIFAAVLMSASLQVAATITIHGVVTAQDTGLPLPGVTVGIGSDCGPDGCFGKGDVLTTGADGRYTASDLQPGLAYVSAAFLPGQANYAPAETQYFHVADGADETIDFALAPGVTIQVTVRRQTDGQPVPDVHIELNSASAGYVDEITTDASGKYTFTQLPADSYTLRTWISGSMPYQDQFYAGRVLQPHQPADALTLTPGQTVNADFALVVGGRLLGTLIDQYSGLPIPDADVSFQLLDTEADICCLNFDTRGAHTDAQGRFELDGLSDAPFYLSGYGVSTQMINYTEWFYGCPWPCGTFKAGSVLNVMAGDTQDIDFLIYPNATITGTVTRRSDGKPIAWANIEAYVPGPLALRTTYTSVSTDDQGHYRLDGAITSGVLVGVFDTVADGVSYIDQIYNNQNCWSGYCVGLGQYVSAPEAQVAPSIDFRLDAGASISGQVFGGYGASIYVYGGDGSMRTRVFSTEQGAFQTAGLQPGTYYLAASPYDTYFACTFYGDVPCHCESGGVCFTPEVATSGAQPIVLGAAGVEGIQILMPASDFVFSNGFE